MSPFLSLLFTSAFPVVTRKVTTSRLPLLEDINKEIYRDDNNWLCHKKIMITVTVVYCIDHHDHALLQYNEANSVS